MVNSSSRPARSAARSARSSTSSGVAHARCGAWSSLRPVLRPRLRARTAGLKGISGGFAAAASPRMVCSRPRTSFAVPRETPSAAGSFFSQTLMSPPVIKFSFHSPQCGRMNRRIRYSRLCVVRRPTSCCSPHWPIHSLTVISPAAGSDQVPVRTFASWSRPHSSAALLVSKPDWLSSPPGILYFTRHGRGPLPRFSTYAMTAAVSSLSERPCQRTGAGPVRQLPPGAAAAGHRPPRALGNDLSDIVIAEPEMLADKGAGNRPGRSLVTEPRLADAQDLGRLSRRVKLGHFELPNHYELISAVWGDLGRT